MKKLYQDITKSKLIRKNQEKINLKRINPRKIELERIELEILNLKKIINLLKITKIKQNNLKIKKEEVDRFL
tara:strand:- start:739 stop:954 length:216 start_codon:yes stop_codon:yes gene_type:complete